MVKARWFKSYTAAERPEHFDFVFQSWDTANKATELCDYSVCTSWGVKTDRGSDRVTGAGPDAACCTCCTSCAEEWSIPN